jgi:hypothetical protein
MRAYISMIKSQSLRHFLLISLFTILAYLPTFSGDFISDDVSLVKNNPYIRDLHSLSSYLQQEDGIVNQKDKGVYRTGYYRPLINITYWLDYEIWGMKAPGFRTTNVILHLLNCFILYYLILMFTQNRKWVFCHASLCPASSKYRIRFFYRLQK